MATNHVMLSYSWNDNPELVRKIKAELDRRGFKTWMDVENMSGNVNRAMAEGVEGAMAVLMCVGKNYKTSRNCEKEAGYADQQHKPILTIIVQKDIKLDGWAGLINGSRLWFDFSNPASFKSKMDEVDKELKGIRSKSSKCNPKSSTTATGGRPPGRRLSERESLEKMYENFGEFELQS